jgi:hypothetical protein
LSTTYPGADVQEAAPLETSPFKSPDERIAALEARIAADRAGKLAAEAEVEARIEERQRVRVRKRRAWQFLAGVVLGVAGTLLITTSITDSDMVPPAFGADSLAGSLSTVYTGAPLDCKAVGGGFECFQPSASGGTTLQVRLDYRGCWEAKPNKPAEVASEAHGCITEAPHPGGTVRP